VGKPNVAKGGIESPAAERLIALEILQAGRTLLDELSHVETVCIIEEIPDKDRIVPGLQRINFIGKERRGEEDIRSEK
jgi:hypothetical protein